MTDTTAAPASAADVVRATRPDPQPAAGEDARRGRPPLTDAARRALAEAEERRERARADEAKARPTEVNGRDGPEPVRYGDWEKNGLISDF